MGVGSQLRGARWLAEAVEMGDVDAVSMPGRLDPHRRVLGDGVGGDKVGVVELGTEAIEVGRRSVGQLEGAHDLGPDAFPGGGLHQ